MAQWSDIMILRLQIDGLRVFSLYLFIHGALVKANSSFAVLAATAPEKESGFRALRQFASSGWETVVNLARQRFSRTVNGQIGVWDMVQLIAVCSLVQAIRIWRTRKEKQHNGDDHSNHFAQGGCNNCKSAVALSRKDSESMKTSKYNSM